VRVLLSIRHMPWGREEFLFLGMKGSPAGRAVREVLLLVHSLR
jgi:hypothetical protein